MKHALDILKDMGYRGALGVLYVIFVFFLVLTLAITIEALYMMFEGSIL